MVRKSENQRVSVIRGGQPAKLPSRRGKLDSPPMLRLIEAAEDIFLAKGYHTATMNDVAKAAGMSKKTVYQLIDSKADLFFALLAHSQSLLIFPATQPGWSMRDILVENLLCLAKFILAPKQIALVRLIMAEYTHSPDLGRVFHQKHVMKTRSRLEDCMADIAAQHGEVLKNSREMSAMLFGMSVGEYVLLALVGFRAPPAKAAVERRIRQAVDVFLAGCDGLCGPASRP